MTGKVLEFKKPVATDPHMAGPATCISCHEKWTYVAPAGVQVLECPGCGREAGVPAGLIRYTSERHATCPCGSQFFCHTAVGGWYCPSCGLDHDSDAFNNYD